MDQDISQKPDQDATSGDVLSQLETPAVRTRFTPLQGALWIAGLAAILGGAAYFLLPGFSNRAPMGDSPDFSAAQQVGSEMRVGDYATAAQMNADIQNDASKSVEEKALALAFALSAEYRSTGDLDKILNEVRAMKEYIRNPAVSVETRVRLINALAAQFRISGGQKAVFDEVFSGAPFDSFKATGGASTFVDASLSIRRLLEWSYSTMPTAYAAIIISGWYGEQYLFNPNLPQEKKDEYAALAQEYLQKAEAADALEFQRIADYETSVLYINYRHWRAITIGRLASLVGEPYKSQYKKEFEDVLAFQDAHTNPMAAEFSLYTRLFFASRLRGAGETEAAKAQLDEIARRMNAIESDAVNSFFSYLRVESSERADGATYVNLIRSNFALSPAFEQAVKRVIGTQ